MTRDMVPTSISGLYQNALLENRHRVKATLAPLRSAQLKAIKSVLKVPSIIERSKKRMAELARSLSERVYPSIPSTTVVTLPKGSMDVFVSTLGGNLNAEHFMRASRESSISHVSIPTSPLLFMPPPLPSPIPSPSDPNTAGPGKIIIHCIRHAEAEHNKLQREGNPNWDHIDPKLTKLGIEQANHLKQLFQPTNQVTHILFSPLCRARQTATIVFRQTVFENGLQMVAYPDLREWSTRKCATGVSLSQMKEDCKLEQLPIDISLVSENWEENNEFGKGRCKRVRKSLWVLGHGAMEKEGGLWHGVDVSRGRIHKNIEIVLVSHGGFLANLTQSPKEGITFRNCQWRTYEFATEEMIKKGERQKYDLVETDGSKKRVYAMPGRTVSN